MFGGFGAGKKRRGDYTGGDDKDLLQRLDEERRQRTATKAQLEAAVKIQSAWRAARVRSEARRAARSDFDVRIAAALRGATGNAAQSLPTTFVRSFAFFCGGGAVETSDLQRAVLLAALFKVASLPDAPPPSVPAFLIPALLRLLPRAQGAPLAAVMKLLSAATAPPDQPSVAQLLKLLVGHKRFASFYSVLGSTMLALPEGPLRAALLMTAARPFSFNAGNVQSSLRSPFTRHVLTCPNILAGAPPALLAAVVRGVELRTIEASLDLAQLTALSANLALLIGAGHFDSEILLAMGNILYKVFPRKQSSRRKNVRQDLGRLQDVAEEDLSSSSDDEQDGFEGSSSGVNINNSAVSSGNNNNNNNNNNNDVADAKSRRSSQLSEAEGMALLKQISVLLAPGTIHQLCSTTQSLPGVCCMYGVLVELWLEQRETIRNSIAFGVPESLGQMWEFLSADEANMRAFESGRGASMGWTAAWYLFCESCERLLFVQTEEDFFAGRCIPLPAVVKLTQFLLRSVVRFYMQNLMLRTSIRPACVRLLLRLYERDCRKAFMPAGEWVVPDVKGQAIVDELEEGYMQPEQEAILSDIPFVLPFLERVSILRVLTFHDGGELDLHMMMGGFPARIRRAHIANDAFALFRELEARGMLKERLRITFINAEGLEEAGVDGGGLYKEFLLTLIKDIFVDHNGPKNLFLETPNHKLYPNPKAVDRTSIEWFEFLGMLVGKALFDNQLLDLPLAEFFLAKVLGKHSSLWDVASLDEELYRSMVQLLKYKGDFADLSLTWSVAEKDANSGRVEEVDLVKNGRNVAVTRENHIHYVYALANYKLNIKAQTKAFLRGFSCLMRPLWVRIFNESELQMLISGGDGPLDVRAWRASTRYSGGYHETQPIIREFWEIVEEFTPKQQAQLLRFMTSCPRPPLHGFNSYYPPLTIHQREGGDEFLPTASTCVNMLKLPRYTNKWVMRERLLYAIESNAGFEFSLVDLTHDTLVLFDHHNAPAANVDRVVNYYGRTRVTFIVPLITVILVFLALSLGRTIIYRRAKRDWAALVLFVVLAAYFVLVMEPREDALAHREKLTDAELRLSLFLIGVGHLLITAVGSVICLLEVDWISVNRDAKQKRA